MSNLISHCPRFAGELVYYRETVDWKYRQSDWISLVRLPTTLQLTWSCKSHRHGRPY